MSHSVLTEMDKFGFVHHRKLNSLDALLNISDMPDKHPEFIHIAEGDICWNFTKGRQDIYFRHPKYLIDSLSGDEIDKQKSKNTLFMLDDFISNIPKNLRFIIELKTGKGNTFSALKKLVSLLQDVIPNRYWIDAFSLDQLLLVKRYDRSVPTSLHTKLVAGRWILKTAPEIIPISIQSISQLDMIDIITLSYNTSVFACKDSPSAVNRGCSEVFNNNKALILGGLKTPSMFKTAMQSSAKAGYAKFALPMLYEDEFRGHSA